MFIADPLLSRTTMRRAGESPPEFTPRQGQYLAFIHAYTLVNGRPPAQADMQRCFRVTPPTVHQMLLTLEKAELISRQPGVARCVAVRVARDHLPRIDPAEDQTVKSSVTRY
jgi:DNA-binding MarR family transcriptional regulator